MSEEIKINKKTLLIMAAIIVISLVSYNIFSGSIKETKIGSNNEIEVIYNSLTPQAKALYYKQSASLTEEVGPRVVELDQLTIGCFGTNTIMQMSEDDTNLGGQCCGALMDAESYEIQLRALNEFIGENGDIDLIPRDPYDVSVTHTQELIALDKDIILDEQQQEIYDEAVEMSHHGGPCCCKCWKWYMMAGLAKKLIVDYGWDEHQITELWDTSSSCGHEEDTDMHEHYEVEE